MSKGWGGCISDKHLTEQCGILNYLLPGDQILADRSFNVVDTVGLFSAEIKTPSFTRGENNYHKWKWIYLINSLV